MSAFFQAVQTAEARRQRYGIELIPDPLNEYDRKAIAVFGVAGGQRWHLGFLDRGTAAEITDDLISKGIPIAGELYNLWLGDDGFMDIIIIVPAPPGNSMKLRLRRRAQLAGKDANDNG